MPQVSLTAPLSYQDRVAEISRRERMAQALQQQAFQPIEQQSYNGIPAPISPAAGLAKVLQSYLPVMAQDRADRQRKELTADVKQQGDTWLGKLNNPAAPLTDPQRRALLLEGAKLDDPRLSSYATQSLVAMDNLQNQKDLKLSPGWKAPEDQWEPGEQNGLKGQFNKTTREFKPDPLPRTSGKYYVVDSSEGQYMVDKEAGTAQAIGRDKDGNLVGIGQPFKFVPTQNGQATGVPQPAPDSGVPAAAPSAPVTGASPAAPPAGVRPVLPSAVDPKAQGAVAAAKASGQVGGTAQGTAAANMPTTELTTNQTIRNIDELMNHPDLDSALGLIGSNLPTIPGYNSDVRSRIEQLKGGNFLAAYTSLRGGGAITEPEGVKAEAAQARLNQAQTPKEFRAALKDMRDLVEARFKTQQTIAGQTPAAAPGGPPAGVDPALWQHMTPQERALFAQ
jgi:hypothetical protein